MPVPTSNQGAESKRWLVPLLANLETRYANLTLPPSRPSGHPIVALAQVANGPSP